MGSERIGIVTGGGKGIGYETVRGLAKSGKLDVVYLTARNAEQGEKAAAQLNAEEKTSIVKFKRLDIADPESVKNFTNFIKESHGGFDVLVQNAGFAFKAAATESFDVQAEETFKINFWGTLEVMKVLSPLVRENGRIVLVSSFTSMAATFGFTPKWGHPVGSELNSINISLTLERLEELAVKFVTDCKEKKNEEIGWPTSAYATSKLFVNGITRVYAREMEAKGKGVLVNCVCPGFVKTDMSSNSARATKLPPQGCKTSLWLSLLPADAAGPQGCILLDA